jgi:PIN domain nuclease of toxin-antitoxin system
LAFLLDTHVLLWNLFKPELLTSAATRILASSWETLYLSSATTLEIAIKGSLGKLTLPSPPEEFIPSVTRDESDGACGQPCSRAESGHAAFASL